MCPGLVCILCRCSLGYAFLGFRYVVLPFHSMGIRLFRYLCACALKQGGFAGFLDFVCGRCSLRTSSLPRPACFQHVFARSIFPFLQSSCFWSSRRAFSSLSSALSLSFILFIFITSSRLPSSVSPGSFAHRFFLKWTFRFPRLQNVSGQYGHLSRCFSVSGCILSMCLFLF